MSGPAKVAVGLVAIVLVSSGFWIWHTRYAGDIVEMDVSGVADCVYDADDEKVTMTLRFRGYVEGSNRVSATVEVYPDRDPLDDPVDPVASQTEAFNASGSVDRKVDFVVDVDRDDLDSDTVDCMFSADF